ncbi:AAA family ATPase, partial [Nocardioides sp.]
MSSGTTTLADALEALVAVAEQAGLDETAARAEGEALAATVAERSRGAFVAWAEETGRTVSAEEFMLAAKRGNRFRAGPTPTMGGLALQKSEHAPAYARALGEV